MSDLFATGRTTNPGGRQYNEDHLLQASAGDSHCWVLADGLGGHGGGDTASRVACEAVIASFRADPSVSAVALQEHLRAADRAVRLEQNLQPALARMRTTIVVLVCNSSSAIWGHAGDSRLYQLRAGRISAQTKDHSLPQALADAGEIRASEIRHHADRSRLMRVLGEEGAAQPAMLPAPVALYAGDAFLLCTDGFWENVFELEMELDFAKSRTPSEWLEFMELRLQERVNGSHDNYTAITVMGDYLPAKLGAAPGAPQRPGAAPKGGRKQVVATVAMLPILAALTGANFAPPSWKQRVEKAAARASKAVRDLPFLKSAAR